MYYTELYFKVKMYFFVVLLAILLFGILATAVAKLYIGMTDMLREKTLEQYEGKDGQNNDWKANEPIRRA